MQIYVFAETTAKHELQVIHITTVAIRTRGEVILEQQYRSIVNNNKNTVN